MNYVLITGATGAIGKEIARGLLRQEKAVILACRNEKKGARLLDGLRKEFPKGEMRLLNLNLANGKSVVECANTIKDVWLEGVIHNAGVMNREYREIYPGLEMTLGVNYLYTAIFNELILSRLLPGSVIVFTTSLTRFLWKRDEQTFSHRKVSGNVEEWFRKTLPKLEESNFSQLGTYGLSKRLITDYARWLEERVGKKNIRVNCADPGIVNTGMITMHRWFDPLANIFFRPFIRKPRHGAIPALRAFGSPLSGKIFCRWRTRKNS